MADMEKKNINHLLTTENAHLHFVMFLSPLTHFLSRLCSCLYGVWFYTIVKMPQNKLGFVGGFCRGLVVCFNNFGSDCPMPLELFK